jgi:hypothetical protein
MDISLLHLLFFHPFRSSKKKKKKDASVIRPTKSSKSGHKGGGAQA